MRGSGLIGQSPPTNETGQGTDMAARHILAIDQGTTSSRAILFDASLGVVASAQREFPQHFPASGWVEHEPEDIWESVLATAREAIAKGGLSAADIAGIGITNQRETTLIWDRRTGRAIHRAIVWQDRRTAKACANLVAAGHEDLVAERTGLRIDPYFSATKIAWLLDNVPGARRRAEAGELAFGTIDCFLLWRLTGGAVHATDATNAARTMLFDIGRGVWDSDLLELFGIPVALLPQVRDCSAHFGDTAPELFGAPIAVRGMAGGNEIRTGLCRAPVLPDDGAVDRPPRPAIPDQRRLALVGDADAGDVGCAQAALGDGLARRREHAVPDILGLMLDPARGREMLRKLALGAGHDAKRRIEQDRPRGGRALVDGEDMSGGHVGSLPVSLVGGDWPMSRSPRKRVPSECPTSLPPGKVLLGMSLAL